MGLFSVENAEDDHAIVDDLIEELARKTPHQHAPEIAEIKLAVESIFQMPNHDGNSVEELIAWPSVPDGRRTRSGWECRVKQGYGAWGGCGFWRDVNPEGWG